MNMTLETAKHYADHIVKWLLPYCEHIEIAGSIRRGLRSCNDVDVVCIPKRTEEKNMLGTVVSERNLLWDFLAAHVAAGKAQFRSGGQVAGKFCILQLPKCQLDVYFATPETLATRLLCRTGSKEHNIWLAKRAQEQGLAWKPYEGLFRDGELINCKTESELYGTLGLGFITPANREEAWLKGNT